MKSGRLWFSPLLLGAIATAWSCGDAATTGPDLQASVSGLASGSSSRNAVRKVAQHTGLVSCSELPAASATLNLGPAGGWISAGSAILVIPKGSLADTVTITVEALADTVRAVRLLPDGLRFEAPGYLVLSYEDCQTKGKPSPKRVAYTSHSWEILEYVPSLDLGRSKKVVGELSHFSNYAVAW